MSDTYVTFHGWVGSDVVHRDVKGYKVANFRVASTPRLKRGGQWVDGATTWYSVSAWRSLADNIADSVKKGDAVIVHGRLRSEEWEREDGKTTSTLVVEASFVGHDLTRGTSVFLRSTKREAPEPDMHDELSEIIRSEAEVTGRFDSWGNALDGEDPVEAGEPAA